MPLILAAPYFRKTLIVEALYAIFTPELKRVNDVLITDLKVKTSGDAKGYIRANVGKNMGRWYWEVALDTISFAPMIGLGIEDVSKAAMPFLAPGSMYFYYHQGVCEVRKDGGSVASVRKQINAGDVIGIALNANTMQVEFFVNGVSFHSSILTSAIGKTVYPILTDGGAGTGADLTANFGATPFKYAAPNGYTLGLPNTGKQYAILKPELKQPGDTLTGDLRIKTTAVGNTGARANIGKSSGKWYWEVTFIEGSYPIIGVAAQNDYSTSYPWTSANSAYFYWHASALNYFIDKGTTKVLGSGSLPSGSVIGIALNADNSTVEFYVNGVSLGICTLPKTTYYPTFSDGANATTANGTSIYAVMDANFGQTAFKYAVPAGFNSGIYD